MGGHKAIAGGELYVIRQNKGQNKKITK